MIIDLEHGSRSTERELVLVPVLSSYGQQWRLTLRVSPPLARPLLLWPLVWGAVGFLGPE